MIIFHSTPHPPTPKKPTKEDWLSHRMKHWDDLNIYVHVNILCLLFYFKKKKVYPIRNLVRSLDDTMQTGSIKPSSQWYQNSLIKFSECLLMRLKLVWSLFCFAGSCIFIEECEKNYYVFANTDKNKKRTKEISENDGAAIVFTDEER